MPGSAANSTVKNITYGRIPFRLILEKQGVDSADSGYDLMADFCEHLIGLPCCLNVTNVVTGRVTVRFVKKDPVS